MEETAREILLSPRPAELLAIMTVVCKENHLALIEVQLIMYFVSVNCTWSAWTAWTSCSATCGGGSQLRSRFVKEAAQNGGNCEGDSVESQACGTACNNDSGM